MVLSLLPFFIGSPLRAIVTSVLAVLLVPSVAFGAVQTLRIEGAMCNEVEPGDRPDCVFQGFKQRLAIARIDLTLVRDLRAADRDNFEGDMKEAERLANAEKRAIEAENAATKEKAEHDLQTFRAAARTAVDRYARANGVHDSGGASGPAAACDLSGRPDLPAAAAAAGSADRACVDAELVTITRGDLDTLTDNSVRLKVAHDWATGPAFERAFAAVASAQGGE